MVIALEGLDVVEPTALVAVTVNVYLVPLFRFVTRCESEVDPALVSTPPLGFDVTV